VWILWGCHVPSFRNDLLLPSSRYSSTLMIKAGGGVQTNFLRPSSGFEEGSVGMPRHAGVCTVEQQAPRCIAEKFPVHYRTAVEQITHIGRYPL